MTFRVTVTYKPDDTAPVMQKTITGAHKVERTWETVHGEKPYEVLRVYDREHTWNTWGIGGILHISMTPELLNNIN